MKLCVVDTEFTTDKATGKPVQVLEYGVALYDTDLKKVLVKCSTIVPTRFTTDKEDLHEKLHGITPQTIYEMNFHKKSYKLASELIASIMEAADYAIAYNTEADTPFFSNQVKWLCAYSDFDWVMDNKYAGRGSLVTLATTYGIAVTTAHRALDDVDLLCKVLSSTNDLPALLADAIEPKLLYKALVDYDNNWKAKSLGFRWDPDNKIWYQRLNQRKLQDILGKNMIGVELIEAGSTNV